MPSVVIRPKALEDLAEIWAYIADDSPRQADAFAAAIDREIRDLARHPLIGRARPELLTDLRSLSFGRYVNLLPAAQTRNRGRARAPRRTRLEAHVRRRRLSLF
jgi:toxin ParE1/3/4